MVLGGHDRDPAELSLRAELRDGDEVLHRLVYAGVRNPHRIAEVPGVDEVGGSVGGARRARWARGAADQEVGGPVGPGGGLRPGRSPLGDDGDRSREDDAAASESLGRPVVPAQAQENRGGDARQGRDEGDPHANGLVATGRRCCTVDGRHGSGATSFWRSRNGSPAPVACEGEVQRPRRPSTGRRASPCCIWELMTHHHTTPRDTHRPSQPFVEPVLRPADTRWNTTSHGQGTPIRSTPEPQVRGQICKFHMRRDGIRGV